MKWGWGDWEFFGMVDSHRDPTHWALQAAVASAFSSEETRSAAVSPKVLEIISSYCAAETKTNAREPQEVVRLGRWRRQHEREQGGTPLMLVAPAPNGVKASPTDPDFAATPICLTIDVEMAPKGDVAKASFVPLVYYAGPERVRRLRAAESPTAPISLDDDHSPSPSRLAVDGLPLKHLAIRSGKVERQLKLKLVHSSR